MTATFQILDRLAAEGRPASEATTTLIAARAGVSIGTLYQYFPDRAALIAAVIDRECDRLLADVDGVLSGDGAAEPDRLIEHLAGRLINPGRLAPALHRMLAAETARPGMATRARATGIALDARLQALATARGLPPDRSAIAGRTARLLFQALAHQDVLPPAAASDQAVRLVRVTLTG
ncbi:TetR/AcrR family transcriptional regulator [Tistrella bauzanensis]|uniref:TetR/AcrR family transcriptional regulator n=1 Tax=Tistrella bauzanensis TaxID=657419 RepID=UPI001E53C11E|nr:TetR/AcrR family transcriptional regulator [Tistrella bauzanensis]